MGHASWSSRVKWKVAASIGSDHLPLLIDITMGPPGNAKPSRPKSNYKKANWTAFQRNIDNNFTGWSAFRYRTLEQALADFIRLIFICTLHCIPRGSLPRPKGWWSPECQQARSAHHAALVQLRQHPHDIQAMEEQQRTRDAANNTYRTAKEAEWRGFAATLDPRTPSSRVWSTIQALDGRGRELLPDSPVLDERGHKAVDDGDKAEMASGSYAATSRVRIPRQASKAAKAAVREYLREHPGGEDPQEDDFSYTEISAVLDKPGGKAPGPDRIHPMLLKKLSTAGRTALLTLVNRSFQEGRVPSDWRRAIIAPIRKKGKPVDKIKSFRPVSLLSCVGKVMEGMMQCRLQEWAERVGALPDSQSGFRKDRSTSDALNQLIQTAFDDLQLQPPRRTLLVAVDFRAAFDTVWRDGLLRILAEQNIPPRWLRWLRSFLRDRRARVRWNEDLSRWRTVKEGVPQGSPLSPLLFLLYVASLPEAIMAAAPGVVTIEFADDFTLKVAHHLPKETVVMMQPALVALQGWCASHYMRIAPEKTVALLISSDPRENNGKFTKPLILCNQQVTFKPSITVLGVEIDSTLTMSRQAKTVAAKIRQRCKPLNAVAARSWGASTTALRDLAMGYVGPAGTYAIGTWFPYTAPSIKDKVEKAFYTAARAITGAAAGSRASATRQEAGLPPMDALASQDAANQYLQYRRFPEDHPLRRLTQVPITRVRHKAKGGGVRGCWRSCALETLTGVDMMDVWPQPILPPEACPAPWAVGRRESTVFYHQTEGTRREDPPEVRRAAAEAMLDNIRRRGHPDVEVWTDGAAEDGTTNGGAGAVVRWSDGRPEVTLSLPVGARTSSTAAEAEALRAGLREVSNSVAGLQPEHRLTIWVAFDSLALHSRLQNPRRLRTDHQTAGAATILADLARRHTIHVFWVPGHAGLPLNEAADEAAGRGCLQDQGGIPPTASAAKAQLRGRLSSACDRAYELQTPPDHLHRRASGGRTLPVDKDRSRKADVLLHQLRLNRAPFLQATKHLWGKAATPACPHCDAEKEDADHWLLWCPRWAAIRAPLFGPNVDITVLQEHPGRVLQFAVGAGVIPPYALRRAR
jgi:ribonuclease HI